MYLEHLVPSVLAVLAAPGCLLRRIRHRELVSFGLLANLAGLERRGLFQEVDGIIDVGANIGQFAYMCHSVWPQLPIYSFEPAPECFFRLEQTFARYSIPGRCFPVAVGDAGGERVLHIYENSVNNSLLQRCDPDDIEQRGVTVRCVTLDELSATLSNLKSPLLKVDVQGYELSVLKGATELLRRCRYVLVEVSFRRAYLGNAHAADILSFLRDHGFGCFDILDVLRLPKSAGKGLREADLLFSKDLGGERGSP